MISDPTVTSFYKQCSLLAGFSIWSRFSSYFSIIFCMSWSAPITLERRGWTLAVADTIKLGFFSAEQNRTTNAAKLGYSYGFAQAAFCWEFGIPWKAPQLILQAIPVKSPSNSTAEVADPPFVPHTNSYHGYLRLSFSKCYQKKQIYLLLPLNNAPIIWKAQSPTWLIGYNKNNTHKYWAGNFKQCTFNEPLFIELMNSF